MAQNLTLYTIHGIENSWDEEPFDVSRLPFDVGHGVWIEDVSGLLSADAFSEYVIQEMGARSVQRLRELRFALVHRYEAAQVIVGERIVAQTAYDDRSISLLRNAAACLRLIRPMRQDASLMYGNIQADGRFNVAGFDHPYDLLETPQNQKHFNLRLRDAEELKARLPEFLRAMSGQFWKFRMSVQFHELGHFQHRDKKARFLLWASAIESLYTSHSRDHQGSLVAKERIKWFLGAKTSIYPKGELLNFIQDPNLKIEDVVDDLYEMRNFHAHGDKLNAHFLEDTLRDGVNGRVTVHEVLFEVQSFIIRTSLLRILRDHLLDHFADAASSEAYFGNHRLTRPELIAKFKSPKQQNVKP